MSSVVRPCSKQIKANELSLFLTIVPATIVGTAQLVSELFLFSCLGAGIFVHGASKDQI